MCRKVALCLSGHPRSYTECFESLHDCVIKPFNADIFIHGWCDDDNEANSVLDLYRPIAYVFERYEDSHRQRFNSVFNPWTMRKWPETNTEGLASMTYKIMSCNELRQRYEQEHGSFDIVIRARFDNNFSRPFTEQDIALAVENTIVIPHENDYRDGINDMFAFGLPDVMNTYSNMHHHLARYAVGGCMFHPETMLRYHLEKMCKLSIKRVDVTTTIVRG